MAVRRWELAVGLVAVFTGCADTEFDPGLGSPTVAADAGVVDSLPRYPDLLLSDSTQDCTQVIDLVFVLDISSSMNFVLDTLHAEINRVVDASNRIKPDARFGLIPFVDNHSLDTSGALEGGVVHDQAVTLQQAFRHYQQVYTAHNRNPGDGPNGPDTQNPICEENALDALHAAASEFPWREDSSRMVIVATDDTFLERPDNYGDRDGDGLTDKQDFPREGDYPALRTMAEAVTALKEKKIRVFSFTRLAEPGFFDLDKCGTGRRLPWAAVPDGWSRPYNGAPPIPAATDGESYDLIAVRDGNLSLIETINEAVLENYCKPVL